MEAHPWDIFASPACRSSFLSVYGKDEVVARVFEMVASDYFVKPFSPTELIARVGAAWRRQPTCCEI